VRSAVSSRSGANVVTNVAKPGRGRPRRYDDHDEVSLIMSAATSVMHEKGYAAATVTEILERGGLGTRAFYRHFKSKDDLLHAIFQREAERARARVVVRLQAAPSHRVAVEEWIDEFLSLGYDPARASRMALIESEIGRGENDAFRQDHLDATAMLTEPLVRVLRAGRRDGSFPSAAPVRDAYLINALVSEVVNWKLSSARPSRRQARADILRFCLPALGWKEPESRKRRA
jgi:AcrR family transcriptional regulator